MMALAASLVVAASSSPFHVGWAEDGIITGATTIIYLMGEQVVKPGMTATAACRRVDNHCDPTELGAIDRLVVGNASHGWETASQWLQYSTYALALGATAVDAANDDSNRADSWGRDAIVLSESVVITQLATNVLKYSLRRARPTQYTAIDGLGLVEEQLSFPSGHTSGVATAATSYAYAFAERHPHDGARYAVFGVGTALTLLTGYARVQSGRHFYSDVLAGAALGVLIGYLVPHLHHQADDRSTTATATGTSGPPMLTFGGRF